MAEKILQSGKIKSINISLKKGEKKTPVMQAQITSLGIQNDAHAADWHRQVSLLAEEAIDKMREKLKTAGSKLKLSDGDFAENITTEGVDLKLVKIGQKIKIAETVLEITQIGKECHTGCEIMKQVGNCIMPKEGIFTKVIKPGLIKTGDDIIIYE
ncbi:MAG: MOSC domain-containing protein [Candidatus Wallbacteria bacterium]